MAQLIEEYFIVAVLTLDAVSIELDVVCGKLTQGYYSYVATATGYCSPATASYIYNFHVEGSLVALRCHHDLAKGELT